MLGLTLFMIVYTIVVAGVGIFLLMRLFKAGMNKIMLLAWTYIFGIVIATVYVVPLDWALSFLKVAYAAIALYILTLILNKEHIDLFSNPLGKIIGILVGVLLAAVFVLLLKPAFSQLGSLPEIIVKIVFVVIALYLLGSVFSAVFNSNRVNIQNVLIVIIGVLLGIAIYTKYLDTSNPRHIVHFAHESYGVKSKIIGRVVREPVYRSDRVQYMIKPIKVQPNVYEDTWVQIEGKGLILFQARQPLMSTLDIDYGDMVQLYGSLLRPRAANNPGGFDYRQYLEAQGIYATMYANYPNKKNPPILKIRAYKQEKNIKNILNFKYQYYLLFNFSLEVKKQMLKVIKQTMKYPESAFLGGVTLGLRYGLEGVHFGKSKFTIPDEFKHSGVNHVLAVSGLHVTIIAAMLWAIFSIFRVPIKIQAPFIIIALIIFTIITGARPATLRAAIMNSLVILTLAYLGQGMRSSLLFGVSVAALLILLFNPILIYQASFTMSFGAILSLGLLTGPIEKILNKYLVGEGFIAAIVCLIGMLAVMFGWKANFQLRYFYLMMLGAIIVIGIAYRLRSGKLDNFSFRKIPIGITGFIAAQFAIALGMMLPSSYTYFGQYPIAGSFANFIAIPLIGVVVPLGMISGIIAMIIPVLGIQLAFLLNAGNFVFSWLFLYVAHISTKLFPYPVATKWTPFSLLLYYTVLLVFIWWKPISRQIQRIYYSLTDVYDMQKNRWVIISVAVVIIIVLGAIVFHSTGKNTKLKVVVLDVGYGGGTVIKFPSGKAVLIDGAFKDTRRNFDAGQRVVAQALAKEGVQSLEAVVLTNPERQNISGLLFILEHYDINHVYDSVFNPKLFDLAEKYKALEKQYAAQQQKYIAFLEKLLNYQQPKEENKGSRYRYATEAEKLLEKIEELEILADESGVLNDETDAMRAKLDQLKEQLHSVKEELLAYFEDENILENIDKWWVQSYIDNYIAYLSIIKKKGIPISRAKYGDVIYAEDVAVGANKKHAELYVLNPREPLIDGSYSDLRNNGVILRLVYDKFSMILPGEVDYPALNKLVEGMEAGDYDLKSTVLVIPNHGSSYAFSESFLEAVDPEVVILQYGSASKVRGRRFARALAAQMKQTLRKYRQFNKNMLFYSTYEDGAVIIETDGEVGEKHTVYTCMKDLNIKEENKRLRHKKPLPSHKIKDRVVGKINLNKATVEDLTKLPRIGYSKALAIIKYRDEIGGFDNIEQIMDVKGIGERTFEKLKDMISVEDEE